MSKRLWPLGILIAVHTVVWAQSELPRPQTDSLWAVWNNTHLQDSIRLLAVDILAWDAYHFTSPDTARQLCDLQYHFAQRGNRMRDMAFALRTRASLHSNNGCLDSAVFYYVAAINIFHKMGNGKGEGVIHLNLGNAYYDHGDLLEAVSHYEMAHALFLSIGDRYEESK